MGTVTEYQKVTYIKGTFHKFLILKENCNDGGVYDSCSKPTESYNLDWIVFENGHTNDFNAIVK